MSKNNDIKIGDLIVQIGHDWYADRYYGVIIGMKEIYNEDVGASINIYKIGWIGEPYVFDTLRAGEVRRAKENLLEICKDSGKRPKLWWQKC